MRVCSNTLPEKDFRVGVWKKIHEFVDGEGFKVIIYDIEFVPYARKD